MRTFVHDYSLDVVKMPDAHKKKISCAVIGAGAFGKHYIRLLQHNQRAVLSAVVNPSGEKRDLDIPPETKQFTDVKGVFDDPSVDAVIIATPLSTHTEIAVAALRAGKHVLLEKPLARNADEAEKIKNAVDASGKIFVLGHQYLYNNDIAVLKNELVGGRIGVVRYIHAEQLYPGPIRFDVGCFREAATHELALIDHLFSPGAPLSVEASGIDLAGGTREDFSAVTIRFESGLFAHIVISQYSPIKSRRMIFGGESGTAVFDDCAPENKVVFSLRPFPLTEKIKQTKSIQVPEGETYIPRIDERREPLALEIEHFLECIENGATPRSDITHALRVERVLDVVSRAMKIA